MSDVLRGKRILLGVSGGIAAYKAAELLRLFVKAGADVRVVMTPAATRLVQPLTFEVLSNHPVGVDLWRVEAGTRIQHTDLGRDSDLIVIAPATANTIGRIAAGFADNLLVSLVMAARTPVLLAPSMNVEMWNNPIVKRNLESLGELGRYHVVTPGVGELACGVEGEGRLAPLDDIVATARRLVTPPDLAGLSFLVTAGPTREPLDPVRFLSNRSTGRMGYALARAAWERGARVTLVSGPTALPAPHGVDRVSVETADELRDAVQARLDACQVLAMVAAVADYRPSEVAAQKIKKTPGDRTLALSRTTDVLAAVGAREKRPLTLGFAAETEHVEARAREKLERKRVDLVFANDVGGPAGGFADERNAGVLVDRWGGRAEFPLVDKGALAHGILDRVAKLLREEVGP